MLDSAIAVSVRGLSKSYAISHTTEKHSTAALVGAFRRLRQPTQRETFWALKDVDFDIHKGDVVGIIGRNGGCRITARFGESSRRKWTLIGSTRFRDWTLRTS
ncbi:MAG: hypothetical protein M3Y28_00550 [Armatimonadota bacterium]|nr:hypothetical protein [Armatimonadota bacterium]